MVDGKGPDLGKEETKKPTQPDMLTKEESLKVRIVCNVHMYICMYICSIHSLYTYMLWAMKYL